MKPYVVLIGLVLVFSGAWLALWAGTVIGIYSLPFVGSVLMAILGIYLMILGIKNVEWRIKKKWFK